MVRAIWRPSDLRLAKKSAVDARLVRNVGDDAVLVERGEDLHVGAVVAVVIEIAALRGGLRSAPVWHRRPRGHGRSR